MTPPALLGPPLGSISALLVARRPLSALCRPQLCSLGQVVASRTSVALSSLGLSAVVSWGWHRLGSEGVKGVRSGVLHLGCLQLHSLLRPPSAQFLLPQTRGSCQNFGGSTLSPKGRIWFSVANVEVRTLMGLQGALCGRLMFDSLHQMVSRALLGRTQKHMAKSSL